MAGTEPPLAVAEFSGIDDVARLERHPVEHRGDLGVRIVAENFWLDLAHPVAFPFRDFVDQVELSRLFEESDFGFYVGEDVADGPVAVLDRVLPLGHAILIKGFSRCQFQQRLEVLGYDLFIADDG